MERRLLPGVAACDITDPAMVLFCAYFDYDVSASEN